MNTSLYELSAQYRTALDTLTDTGLDEQTIADTLEGLEGALEVKAQNVAMFVRNLESTAEAIKKAETEMASRRKALERRADSIKAYILENMQRAGITKIECPYFQLAIRKNPASVVIDDLDQIPAEFIRLPPPPPPAPDKKAIAEAIKGGANVPGVHLEQSERLHIG